MKRLIVVLAMLLVLVVITAFIFYSRFTLFVVQPIGAIPEGRTLILRRTTRLKFIDRMGTVYHHPTLLSQNDLTLRQRRAGARQVQDDPFHHGEQLLHQQLGLGQRRSDLRALRLQEYPHHRHEVVLGHAMAAALGVCG